MGLTSDSETESISMKSRIDEMNVEPIIVHRDKDIAKTNNFYENNEQFTETNNSNLAHKCTYPGCNKSFNKPSRLSWHIRQHTGERIYKCSFKNCDRSYTNSSHLKRHLKVHETVHESVVCGVCQLTLKNRTNLLKHHRRFHENKNRIFCEICDITFRKKYKYDEHMTRFHNGKLFKCNKCDREYKNLIKLRRHEKVHDVKYECPENDCKMVFETYLEFRSHAKAHPKEYICDKCQKKFTYRNRFNRHIKTHEGKLLACPYDGCNKTYYFSNELRMHIRTKHDKSKLFECDLCKEAFTYKSVLRKHMQIIHLNIKLNEPRVYKKGEERKERKDIGKQTRSMPSVLTGVFLPHQVEEAIINRQPKIQLSDTNFESTEAENTF